jgi:hypothetical protein
MQTNLLKPKTINVEQLGHNRAKVELSSRSSAAMATRWATPSTRAALVHGGLRSD